MLRVGDALQSGVMPPEGEARPNAEEIETINLWLDAAVSANNRGPGRVTLRRLNRAEYNNTVHDLTEP